MIISSAAHIFRRAIAQHEHAESQSCAKHDGYRTLPSLLPKMQSAPPWRGTLPQVAAASLMLCIL